MDPIAAQSQQPPAIPDMLTCPFCHQPVLSTYYYCPNCASRLTNAPLSTSPATQAWIYFQALILPMFLYLFIAKWPALRYYQSRDPKVRAVGTYAFIILFVSTIATIWLSYASFQAMMQSVNSSISADFNM